MSTWGASKKKSSGKRSTSVNGRSRTARTTRPSGGSGSKGGSRSTGSVRDATPPSAPRSRRGRANAELREAVEGREHEFLGLGLIGGGILLGLGIYFNLAGPLGRGTEQLTGWFTGVGRYTVPAVLVLSGVAMVRRGRSYSPFRLAVGWALVSAAVLGLLHIARGPDKIWAGFDDLGDGGGWLGALVAEPLRALLASAGAVVVLLALLLGGVLLVTRTSLRTMATQTGGVLNSLLLPLGRAARSGIGNLSTLNSDRDGSDAPGLDVESGPITGEPAGLQADGDRAVRLRGRRRRVERRGGQAEAKAPAAPVHRRRSVLDRVARWGSASATGCCRR